MEMLEKLGLKYFSLVGLNYFEFLDLTRNSSMATCRSFAELEFLQLKNKSF